MGRFETVTIVGVGLIGGSLGQALRARSLATRVLGLGRHPDSLDQAVRRGAIDAGTTDPRVAYAEADAIVVCTPVSRIVEDVLQAASLSPASALITDAGSTKGRLVLEIERDETARSKFVGAHPLAGSERKGVDAARPDLFDGRVCVLTPTERTPADRLSRATDLWRAVGCRTRVLDLDTHDAALARTSHLPHAVAASLARAVPEEWLDLGAGAFRDCTRVASAPADLWASIFLDNRRWLLPALDALRADLQELESALRHGDAPAIERWWEIGRDRRDHFARLQADGNTPTNP